MDYVTIEGTVISTTDAAVLIDMSCGETWVPRSLIEEGDLIHEFDDETQYEIAEWFVEKEGLY